MENYRPAKPGRRPTRIISDLQKNIGIGRWLCGEPKASIARDLEIPESTFRGWCKVYEKLYQQRLLKAYSAIQAEIIAANSSTNTSSDTEDSEEAEKYYNDNKPVIDRTFALKCGEVFVSWIETISDADISASTKTDLRIMINQLKNNCE